MTEYYRIRYYWYGTTYFDYLAELPSYAKILTEIPMQTAEEIPSTECYTNITESKGGNIPQLAERPPNTDRRCGCTVNVACYQSKGLKP
jgi:hypothetical protein